MDSPPPPTPPSPADPAPRAPERELIARLEEAEHRLGELESLLARRSRMEELGELAGGLAHEIANLLGPMGLAARALGGEGCEDAARLMTCLEGCGGLVLAVLRASQGVAMPVRPFDAGEMVDEAVVLAAALDRRGRPRVEAGACGMAFGCRAVVRQAVVSGLVFAARRGGGLSGVRVEAGRSTWNIERGVAGVEWGGAEREGDEGLVSIVVRAPGVSVRGEDLAWLTGGSWSSGSGGSTGLAMACRLLGMSGGAVGVGAGDGLEVRVVCPGSER